ncbi:MAG: hypothetical protein K6E49_04925 [Lachnospiraceae bacterium]|nr:hypothetical protein [Lachnospiraceae bacterium]
MSQDYYYSYRITEKALESIPSINHVILGAGYFSPYMDLSRAVNKGELNRIISVYDRYFHDIHNMPPQKYRELKEEEPNRKSEDRTEEIFRRMFEARKFQRLCQCGDRSCRKRRDQ